MKVRVNIIGYLSLVLTLFAACTADNEDLNCIIKEKNAKTAVTLEVDIPNIQASRSLTPDQEKAIGDYVLFAYEGSTLIAVLKTGDEDIKLSGNNLYVLLPETANNVDFHLFTNVDLTKVGTLESYSGKTKEQIFAGFEFSCATQLAKKVVPMYGMTTVQGITLGTKGHITLVRSMAKVTVNVSDTKFTPKTIEIVNVNDQATVYYTDLSAVNLPTSATIGNKTQSFAEGTTTASIYFGETNNTAASRISVILYGKYKKDNDEIDAYYRFDMITTSSERLSALLRNHHYIFSVSGINHMGSGSRVDALNKAYADNEMVDSNVDFFDITEESILSITSDDASYVGVSSENITMKNGVTVVGLDVLTNNTATPAWVIDDSECSGKFDFSGNVDPTPNIVRTLWIWKNNVTTTGEYVFYITAGNIRKAIKVTVE